MLFHRFSFVFFTCHPDSVPLDASPSLSLRLPGAEQHLRLCCTSLGLRKGASQCERTDTFFLWRNFSVLVTKLPTPALPVLNLPASGSAQTVVRREDSRPVPT